MVRIKAGPFTAFTGKVEGINQSKLLLKVKIDIFGRISPIKVSFAEAENLEFQHLLPLHRINKRCSDWRKAIWALA